MNPDTGPPGYTHHAERGGRHMDGADEMVKPGGMVNNVSYI